VGGEFWKGMYFSFIGFTLRTACAIELMIIKEIRFILCNVQLLRGSASSKKRAQELTTVHHDIHNA